MTYREAMIEALAQTIADEQHGGDPYDIADADLPPTPEQIMAVIDDKSRVVIMQRIDRLAEAIAMSQDGGSIRDMQSRLEEAQNDLRTLEIKEQTKNAYRR